MEIFNLITDAVLLSSILILIFYTILQQLEYLTQQLEKVHALVTKLDVTSILAQHKGDEERGRRTWALAITAVTVTITIAALIIAFVIVK